MWEILNGTIVNTATVIVGSLAGLAIGGKLPRKYQAIVLNSLGLITITLGIDAAVLRFADAAGRWGPEVMPDRPQMYGARLAVAMIASLLIGAIIGTALRLHERIENLGKWIHTHLSRGDGHRFAEGFLTASVIFCVGPLTLLGCLENGARGDPSYLYIKAMLDGFCSMALASTLGLGVLASVLTIIFFQGGLAVLASYVAEPLHPLAVDLMTIVGGIILLATALMILEIKKIPVADMLPGIFLPPLLLVLTEAVAPGTLLPAAG